MNLGSFLIYRRRKINSASRHSDSAFSGRVLKRSVSTINAVDRPQEFTIAERGQLKRSNFRGPEETETAKVIARRVIHSPHGNVSFFRSLSVLLSPLWRHKGGDRIVQNNYSLETDNLFAPWQKSRITNRMANYNSRRNNANLSVFLLNGLRTSDFNVF